MDSLGRAQGCLLGQLAGDSLGSLVEFQSADTIRMKYPDGPRLLADGGTWHILAGQPTDDSELALALARAIVKANGFDEEAVARAYAAWYGSGPFDIGGTTRSALDPAWHAVKQGGSAASAARGAANAASQANGALMRVSPLGILGSDSVFDEARTDAGLTHPHPVCQDSSAVLAATIAFAIRNGGMPSAAYDFAIRTAAERKVQAAVMKALVAAESSAPADFYTHQGWVLIALQNAFYQLLHAELEEGIVNTVRFGGDTDTNGAIAGALLGAVHGWPAVPAQWVNRILNCRPKPGVPGVVHPRPQEYWPVDALELAESLLRITSTGRKH